MKRMLVGLCMAATALFTARTGSAQTYAQTAPGAAPMTPPPYAVTPTTGPTAPLRPQRTMFEADPVVDGAVLSLSAGWAILSTMIIGTGEIRPQQISPTFDTKDLLPFDRVAVTQTPDPNAKTFSNVGLGLAIGYAGLDPILSGVRAHSARTALVDALIYAEAIAVTDGMTNLSKLAVRRPRPIAYVEFNACRAKHPGKSANQLAVLCDNTSTDSALSFVSGHAATTGAIWGAATYLAFSRSPHSIRPWLTLIGGGALTAFVGYERVRSADHFPSDVVAGAFAGAGVGVMTAHLHRADSSRLTPLWVGWYQAPIGDGGAVTLNGLF
ncbi:MAG TPA: phosphatase PAP2 family protein [Minicystis sp.]|nr:phosphatase PAP2 family protein [Minicystis sp.]